MNGSSEKIFGLLTMCRKAGRMTMGFDSVKESILTHKARLILIASDLSPKTEKEVRFFASKGNIPVTAIDAGISDIGYGIGRKTGIIAVCDEGFAMKLTELTAVHQSTEP